jgi:hypothetical protein
MTERWEGVSRSIWNRDGGGEGFGLDDQSVAESAYRTFLHWRGDGRPTAATRCFFVPSMPLALPHSFGEGMGKQDTQKNCHRAGQGQCVACWGVPKVFVAVGGVKREEQSREGHSTADNRGRPRLCACRCILCDPRRSLRRAPAPSSPVAARLPIQSRATPVGRIAPC